MLPLSRPRFLDGPPFALPAALDRLSERWWSAAPRSRVVVVLAVAILVVVVISARFASSPYGAPVDVLVAARDLAPGERLDASALQRRTWPGELVPADAVTGAGGTVVTFLPAGSVVTSRHLGDDALASSLPPGTVAVPIPAELVPSLVPGTSVDLVGTDEHAVPVVLAAGATVLDGEDDVAWFAVPQDAAVRVAAAARRGEVVPVVRP